MYIYTYIYIHYTYSTLKFVDNIFIEGAMPEKALKYALFRNCKTKILVFECCAKISLEMKSTHTFNPILIPNTSYVKILILFAGGPRTQKKINEI